MRALATVLLAACLPCLATVARATEIDSCAALPADGRAACFATALAGLQEALARDEGTVRAERRTAAGTVAWSVPIAVGAPARLDRAARALVDAGRRDEARALRETALGSVLDEHPTPLVAAPWFEPLPPVRIARFGGAGLPMPPPGARAVVLSFWASWCPPCVEELPGLQRLWEQRRNDGLAVLAVNMQEPEDVARDFLERLGVDLPLATYDDDLDRAVGIRSLPTVIVADGAWRVRSRWGGYRDSVGKRLATLVGELLDGPAEPGEELAERLGGAARVAVRWSRTTPAPAPGLIVVEDPAGAVLRAVAGRAVLDYGPDGRIVARGETPFAASALRRVDLDGDGRDEVYGFRPGSTRIARFDAGAAASIREAPAPVMALDGSIAAPDGSGARLLVGTLDGLFESTADGGFRRIEGFASVTGLALAPPGAAAPIAVLEPGPRLSWLDASLHPQGAARPDRVASVADWGADRTFVALPDGVHAVTVGRFVGPRELVAVAAEDQLVLIDRDSGTVELRARWDGIVGLAAGDLDGDGVDELAVSSGSRVTVLDAGTGSGRSGL